MRLVTPVDVSLWTTMTALMPCSRSATRRASISAGCAPRRQSPAKKSTSNLNFSARPFQSIAKWPVFAMLWKGLAEKFKLEVDFLAGDWRRGAQPAEIEARLVADREHGIKAVMVVHNETSTGVTSRIHEIRKAVDRAKHPALLLVDTISSLASIEYEHDAWGVDVTVSCSQKGLMLPPGLGFNAVSEKALLAAKANQTSRSYWDWHEILQQNKNGSWPYTPATNLLYGLKEAIKMLMEEGLDKVFARHLKLAAATRAAVRAWNLEILCQDPKEHSPILTAVVMPTGHD